MPDNSQAQELAKQMVTRCPKGYWVVEDHYSNTVYYKNQKLHTTQSQLITLSTMY
jgi:hypothetical protein